MKNSVFAVAMLLATGVSYAQTADTTISQAALDSIDAKLKLMKLKEISVAAPKPVYSMTGEVVSYNVENDETVRGLTAFDAIRNAPTVSVDVEGNITMRGSEKVEVWLNGQPTRLDGPLLKAFFEAMPAEALARVEVIKNPSAKYMVEEGAHILNVVTSARLRTSRLLILGLSGNTRPYLSPWFSVVRNSDRLKFTFHLAGSTSHHSSTGDGSYALLAGGDTTSVRSYRRNASGARVFGNNNFSIGYRIDSLTDFSLMSWNMLTGDYDDLSSSLYDQYDLLPAEARYRYLDTSSSRSLMVNGFTHFDLKRRLGRQGHNIKFGGVWNYLFNSSHGHHLRHLLMASGNVASPLLPYDRDTRTHYNRNTIDLSLTYNRPLGEHDELQLRLSGRPYGNSFYDRTILLMDSLSGSHSLPDSLRNYVLDYLSRQVSGLVSWRHEWQRTTLTADLSACQSWLAIANTGLFPDDTAFRFFDLGPSLGLTHRTAGMHYLRLRYSLTVSHPSGENLTRSRRYADHSFSTGNRDLQSALTHKASLSWNKYFERMGNVSVDAYCNRTAHGIESITLSTPVPDAWTGRLMSYSLPVNTDWSYKCGLDANATWRPVAWTSLSLNGSLFREGYRAGDALQERTSWHLYLRWWAKVVRLVNLDANLDYGSPSLAALFTEQRRALTLGLGASSTLLDGRLSLSLYVSDLLDSNRYREAVSNTAYASASSSHYSSRYLTFGLTFRLGKLDLQYQAMGGAAGQ